METTVEILNKIANKLGDENADQYTTVAQALGSIANALGNADPDKIQTVPEALEEILAVAGGGGGSSDYTTCKLTVKGLTGNLCVSYNLEGFGTVGLLSLSPSDTQKTVDVILYKGAAVLVSLSKDEITVTGAIEYNEDMEAYIITGDCSIEGGK